MFITYGLYLTTACYILHTVFVFMSTFRSVCLIYVSFFCFVLFFVFFFIFIFILIKISHLNSLWQNHLFLGHFCLVLLIKVYSMEHPLVEATLFFNIRNRNYFSRVHIDDLISIFTFTIIPSKWKNWRFITVTLKMSPLSFYQFEQSGKVVHE